MSSVFLDTAFAIALVSKRDTYHDRANMLLKEIEQNRIRVGYVCVKR